MTAILVFTWTDSVYGLMSSKNVSSFQLDVELFNSCKISENYMIIEYCAHTDLKKPYCIDSSMAYARLNLFFVWRCFYCEGFLYPRNEVRGGILDSPCLSVRLSVCPLTFRVHPVASQVQDGFFPYLVQMISSMRGCVACDDPWPWPISSRSFGLDLENHVRSVASTVLDGFFLYLAQMITIIRGCVACYFFFRIWKFEFLANFWKFSALTLKKKIYSSRWILSIFSKWSLVWEGVLHIMTFDLDLYLQGHLALALKIVSAL